MLRCLSVLAILVCAPSIGAATTWRVLPDGTGDAPTIQAAVNLTSNGDVVELADGTYTGEGNRDVVAGGHITIRSESGNADACIVDCQFLNLTHAFDMSLSSTVTLEGITILRAKGEYVVRTGGPVIGCVIADYGVRSDRIATLGIRTFGLVRDCILRDGAIGISVNQWALFPSIVDCVISGQRYAAIETFECRPDISGTILTDNVRGLWCFDCDDVQLTGCTFSGNAAAIVIERISYPSVVSLDRCILSFNDVTTSCDDLTTLSLGCSDVYGNLDGDWTGCIAGLDGTDGNFSADPAYCGADDGDYTLRSDSPCAPPGVTGCGLVGALPVGCGPVSVTATSWGKLKGAYR
jgi:hypothetical protein